MERLTFIIILPVLLLISWMPFGILYLFSDILYYLLYHVAGYRKNVVRKNIKLSGLVKTKKEALAIERKFYRYLCDLFLEIIKVKGMSKNAMMRRFKLTNPSMLKDFARMNKSVFVMAGHYGNFEWLLSLGHHAPHNAHGIYAPLQNPYFDKYLKSFYKVFPLDFRKALEQSIKLDMDKKEKAI